MSIGEPREAFVNMRCREHERRAIERACEVTREHLSEFVRRVALEAARKVTAGEQTA